MAITPLWPHQRAALDHALSRGRRGAYLALGMGTGKTLCALHWLDAIAARRALIVAPRHVLAHWPAQGVRHGSTWDIRAMTSGTVAARAAALRDHLGGARVAAVINYETLARGEMQAAVRHAAADALVLDEAHRTKSPGGKVSRYLATIARSIPYRLGLSGTPMPNGPLDIYAQARAIAPEVYGYRYAAFRARYAACHPQYPSKVLRYINLDDLERKFATFALRIDSDVLDLPEATHSEVTFRLGARAMRIYRDLLDDFISEVDSGEIAAGNAAIRAMKLRQITGGSVRDAEGELIHVDDAKETALREVLTDTNEPIVIFCQFRSDLEAAHRAAAAAGKRSIEISGRRAPPPECMDGGRWIDGDVLVAQIDAAREGLDFTRAPIAIFYSHGYSPGVIEQAEKRLHRPGQRSEVRYVHLVADGTIDLVIADAVRRKQDIISSVMESIKRKETQ